MRVLLLLLFFKIESLLFLPCVKLEVASSYLLVLENVCFLTFIILDARVNAYDVFQWVLLHIEPTLA